MKVFCEKCSGYFDIKTEEIKEPNHVLTIIECTLCGTPAAVLKADGKVNLTVEKKK